MDDLLDKEITFEMLKDTLKRKSDMIDKNGGAHTPDLLLDKHNRIMLDNVRPRFWVDPSMEEKSTV